MADPLSAVSPDVEARKRALLEAVASGGTAGLQAFEEGEKALTASKGAAIDRAGSLAGLIGGPEAQGFVPQAGAFHDRGIASLTGARTAFTEDLARRGIAQQNYLSQVAAAAPLVRADADRRRQALERASSGSSSSTDILQDVTGAAEITQAQANEALAAAQADADKASTKAASIQASLAPAKTTEANTLAQIKKNAKLLDQRGLSKLPAGQADRLVKEQGRLYGQLDAVRANRSSLERALAEASSPSQPTATRLAEAQARANRPMHEVAREIAIRGGVAPERALGLIGPEDFTGRVAAAAKLAPPVNSQATAIHDKIKSKTNSTPAVVASILSDQAIKQYIAETMDEADDDTIQDDVLAGLKADFLDKGQDRTYYTLREILLPRFPTKSKK